MTELESAPIPEGIGLRDPATRWALIPLMAAIVLVADQWSKAWIRANIPLNGSWAPFPALETWFNIVHFNNTGAAFGLLRGQGGLFIVIALVVIVAVLVYSRQLPADNWGVRFCLGLQLGGAIGNLVDRLHLGHVTDFLLFSLPVNGRIYQWPAWNVADGSIVVGVIVLALLLLRTESVSGPSKA